ncbi:TIGR03016 family PEP-CTERM system-associated outer membrane protein [Marinobacterium rhizophilum]|uniref:TIGR03016 family PEP-CTERM system-associated outer membrane protein n=1 Tax=Marinobacterium rhizophilum TaxID=420402 RepID=UPI0003A296B1|nr:TIGR03016 family PEP-CTERM system-associated outer membrane protein [Marinobacterium rhizophilum]
MAIMALLSDNQVRWLAIRLTTTALLTPVATAQASDWKFTPEIQVTEHYTSNLNLTSSDEEASLISEVRPGFSLSKQGSHLQANMDYRLQYLNYSSDQASDDYHHQLGLSANSELIDDRLFLDARSTYSQQLINNRSASAGDSLSAPDNFTDTFTFQITPRWRQRLGRYSTFGADFSYDMVRYDGVNDNSDGYRTNFFLDNQSNPSKFYWALNLDTNQATPDTSATSQSETLDIELGYRYSHQLDGKLRYGYVDNHLDNPTQSEAQAGDFWGADLSWNPSSRTSLSASYNSRLQSNQSYGLTFNHRQRHTNWSLAYNKNISSVREELLQLTPIGTLICPSTASFAITDCRLVGGGSPVLPGPGERAITLVTPLPTLSEEQFIQQSLNANLVISKGKSLWTLGLFRTEREFQVQARTEEDMGANAGWTIQVSGRTSLSTLYTWSRLEADLGTTDYQQALSLNMVRQLDADSSLNLAVKSTERDSADDNRTFQEFRMTLGFSHLF